MSSSSSCSEERELWLLVIAHPDDESMFFAPTLRRLLDAHRAGRVLRPHILCLSNGGHHGLGGTREKEMVRAATVLGMYDGLPETNDDGNDADAPTERASPSSSPRKGVSFHDDDDDDDDDDANGPEERRPLLVDDKEDGPLRTPLRSSLSHYSSVRRERRDVDFERVRRERVVEVVNHKGMRDGPHNSWDADLVADTIQNHILKIVAPMFRDDDVDRVGGGRAEGWWVVAPDDDDAAVPRVTLRVLTFDRHGVSGHRNHSHAHRGVARLLRRNAPRRSSRRGSSSRSRSPPPSSLSLSLRRGPVTAARVRVEALQLRTEPRLLRKYGAPLYDVVPALATTAWAAAASWTTPSPRWWRWWRGTNAAEEDDDDEREINDERRRRRRQGGGRGVHRIFEPRLVWRAMAAHESQFVWYRRLSVIFSRYTYVNELEEITTGNNGGGANT